ncbi:hypothetical protein [Actinomadura sp. 3N508]|uniref:hypothetical protein n=1 Tax=Actinomadura sp. 3N508 TaxID=3375153 RepID=UPI003790A3A4
MRIYYDCEFIEAGPDHPIELVSIGLVADDGREFYAVSSEFDTRRLLANPWLVANVWPSLPQRQDPPGHRCRCIHGHLDLDHPDVQPRAQIASAVHTFIAATPDPVLCAWYGAYDHVVLCQLWGSMVDLPPGVPMWTYDLRQETERLGNPQLPEQPEGLHNALADARHNKVRAAHLDRLARAKDSGR